MSEFLENEEGSSVSRRVRMSAAQLLCQVWFASAGLPRQICVAGLLWQGDL